LEPPRVDFYLLDAGIYIEHFALSENGDTPPFIDLAEYTASRQWKLELHEKHGTILIETFSYEQAAGRLKERLAEKLRAHGVSLNPIPREEIFAVLNEQGRVAPFTQLVATFLQHFKGARLSFEAVEALGDRFGDRFPHEFDRRLVAIEPGDIALLCTTSGTTSVPKLAMLSHANLLAMAEQMVSVDPMEPGDEFVCLRPDFIAHDQDHDTAFAQVARDAIGEDTLRWTVGPVDQAVEARGRCCPVEVRLGDRGLELGVVELEQRGRVFEGLGDHLAAGLGVAPELHLGQDQIAFGRDE